MSLFQAWELWAAACGFVLIGIVVVDFIVANWGWKGDWRWPILRDLIPTVTHFHHFHDYALEILKRHGSDFITWRLGLYDILVVTSPADVEHLLKKNWKNYAVARGLRGDALADLLGHGIFHADGMHWYVQRKHASREFSAHIFRTFMTGEFIFHSRKLLNILQKQQGAVDLHAWFFKLTLDAFGHVAFGLNFGGLDNKPIPFAAAFDRAQEITAQRLATKLPWVWKAQRLLQMGDERELVACSKVITSFVDELISERRASPELATKEDLLSKLMSASDADADVPPELKANYLRDMTVNFIIAGRDTTACALSWFVFEMCKNRVAEERLVQELRLILEEQEAVSFDALPDCHYLTACLHETLRLHPSVPFNPKTAMEDDVFPSGGRVKKGASVAYAPYISGRLEHIWGPDASEFRPERWLDPTGRFVREDACKFSSFQAGPRLCLGVDMAMLEMKIVVCTLLPQLQFSLLEEPEYRVGLVLQMKHGLKVSIQPRSK